jgi:hypothetical protein
MKILFGDFSAKLGREDIYRPTVGDLSLHENNNNNGFSGILKCNCEGHSEPPWKYNNSWTSSDGRTHSHWACLGRWEVAFRSA